jgi:uncharacterized protein YgiM (DUF1202 family)
MHHTIPAVPRWLAATALGALMLSAIMLSGTGNAGAQDATPTAIPTATATETATETATAEPTGESTATAETSFAVGDELVVTSGPLNVRDAAGLDADVLFQLDTGAGVEITDGPTSADDLTWYEVLTSDNETGWVAGEFLGTETTADFAAGEVVEVVDGPLNVRDDSSLDGEVLLQLETGETATVLDGPVASDGFNWYHVQIDADTNGWVAGEFLGAATSGGFAAGEEVAVADGPLNVRDDSTPNGAVLLQLETGETAVVVSGPVAADGFNWYEVEIDDQTSGWVAGEFLTASGGSSTGALNFGVGDAVRAGVEDLNFRAEAGLDADMLDTVTFDALFLVQDGPVSADGYTWYQVFNYYYGEGWVAGELMTLEPNGFPVEEDV